MMVFMTPWGGLGGLWMLVKLRSEARIVVVR
jgi:hypothetical protein